MSTIIPPTRPKIADSVLELIGNTPLIRLSKLPAAGGVDASTEILCKIKSSNPANSVKDRIDLIMIEQAKVRGDIKPGETVLVEPTSGNTGIGLAMVAASKGYKLILTMPESMSMERRVFLKAFGADLVLTPDAKSMPGVIAEAEKIAQEQGGYMLQQFNNADNPKVHRETTGPEIWADTDGKIDVLVGGVGTGGMLTERGQYLKPLNKDLKIVAVEPVESPMLSGGSAAPHKIQGIDSGFIPGNANTSHFDKIAKISSPDAMEMARKLATGEGIFCGISSGAAVGAAIKLAAQVESKRKRFLVIIPSFGERYISTLMFQELREECAAMEAEE